MIIRNPIGRRVAWVRGAALFVSILVSTGAADAAGPFRPFQFGSWSGGAYTNEQTGAFSHCAAGVPYMSGITMMASPVRAAAILCPALALAKLHDRVLQCAHTGIA
jgi:hypothetical protein